MFKKNDPNSLTKYYNLKADIGKVTVTIGQLIANYYIVDYNDVQIEDSSSVNKLKNRKYLVHCTQRIIIGNNNSPALIPPSKNTITYNNYPALIDTSLTLKPNEKGKFISQLLDYSPKTVNTQVQTSGISGSSTGTSTSNSKSSTTGSTISETNSFGVSVTVGSSASLMDASVNDSVTENYEHSSTVSHEHSNTKGSELSNSKNNSLSESESMSIKDWGAYAYVEQGTIPKVGWIFGQEYPWNAVTRKQFKSNAEPNNQVELLISKEEIANLYDGEMLLPPSHLSLFGINFVSKSLYLIILDDDFSESVKIEHSVLYSSASHMLNANEVNVYIDKQPTELKVSDSININLPIMALDVLGLPNKQAIIGFIPNKFIVAPRPITSGTRSAFKIIATTNTLYIKDTTDYSKITDNGVGFSASETCLSANFSQQGTSLNLTAYFKVVDTANYYSLYLKHWKKKGSKGIKLTFIINGDSTNAIVKYVDSEEAEGAEKNLLTISLRDLNYASVDYHDYLQLGLNSIEMKIEPIDGQYSDNLGYEVRAISIEKV